AALRDHTGESAQLYRRQGDHRICVAAAERPIGLRDSVPLGSTLTMKAGSAAQILLAWEEPDRLHRGLLGARFTATQLSAVRGRGPGAVARAQWPGGRRAQRLRADRADHPPARQTARRLRDELGQSPHRDAPRRRLLSAQVEST